MPQKCRLSAIREITTERLLLSVANCHIMSGDDPGTIFLNLHLSTVTDPDRYVLPNPLGDLHFPTGYHVEKEQQKWGKSQKKCRKGG